MSLASSLWRFRLHIELDVNLKGILNLECAVRPPGSSKAAIPDEATAKAIFFCDLTLANKHLYKNVLPVPKKFLIDKINQNESKRHLIN